MGSEGLALGECSRLGIGSTSFGVSRLLRNFECVLSRSDSCACIKLRPEHVDDDDLGLDDEGSQSLQLPSAIGPSAFADALHRGLP